MEVRIVHVGKLRNKGVRDLVGEYEKRLQNYVSKFERQSVQKSDRSDNRSVAVSEEADNLREAKSEGIAVALDEDGRQFSSTEFAQKMRRWVVGPQSRITFFVGGAFGLGRSFRRECDTSLSLSKMTFPHQLATLVLSEQLYRCFTILKGEPYHK